MMGKHEQRDPWLDEWLRMMRPMVVVLAHITGGLLVHAGTVWLFYTVTH